jgi:YD repeat-containing protein
MVRLKHAAKTLRARSYIQNTPEPYGNLIDSTIEERYPGGNIKTLAFRNRGQTPVIKVKNYLNNNEHQLSTVLIPKTNKGKMTPVEEYYYGKSGLDSSKISLMDGGVETSVYERGTPLNILSSIRISSPDGYGKIKFDLEGKKIEDKRFRQNAGVISITDYIYDYKGNNIAINISDGEYHLKYRTENTFDDDNNLIFTKNTDGQTKYKYNNLKQKTEEISYQGDGRVKRKTFFDYNIDGSIARIISNDMERSFFITYNRFGQETENYFSESNGPITKVVTMHAGKFITGKKTIFQERVLSDTSYKYDAKKRVIEQTTYFEGSQIGDIEKTINRYDTGCPIPNQTLVYWGERLYSKTTFELTPACKIKSRKVSQPSGLYIVANDDPTPRGIDSYKPIYDLKKRLIEETIPILSKELFII